MRFHSSSVFLLPQSYHIAGYVATVNIKYNNFKRKGFSPHRTFPFDFFPVNFKLQLLVFFRLQIEIV